jgi:hypothetical protein
LPDFALPTTERLILRSLEEKLEAIAVPFPGCRLFVAFRSVKGSLL